MLKKSIKLLALLLSLALLVTVVAGIPFGASAAEPTLLTVNDVKGEKNGTIGATEWPNNMTYANINGGGVKVTFTTCYRDYRLGTLAAVTNLDGLHIKIANITQTEGAPLVGFILSNAQWGDTNSNRLMIGIDTEAGQLKQYYNRGDFTATGTNVLLTNDALKYANITGKEVTIDFSKMANGDYTITVDIAGTKLPCTLTAANLAQHVGNGGAVNPNGNIYLSLTPAAKEATNGFTVDLLSYWYDNPVWKPVYTAIAALDTVDLLENGNMIQSARALYDALGDTDKASVTNYASLVAAENEYVRLAAAADADLIKMNIANARLQQAGLGSTWGALKVSDISTGGLHYSFNSSSINMREGYVANVNIDGLKLQFDNFRDTLGNGSYPNKTQFVVLFGNGGTYGPAYGDGALAILLDPYNGKVFAYSDNKDINSDTAHEIISSNLLKGEAVFNRRFSYTFAVDADKNITMTVHIAGTDLTGTIPAAVVSGASILYSTQNTGVMLTSRVWPGNSSAQFDIDFIGIDTVIGGTEPNLPINATTVTAEGTNVDSGDIAKGVVYLTDKDSGISFKVNKADTVKALINTYDSTASMRVYVDGQDKGTIISSSDKQYTKWFTLAEDLDPYAEHTIKILRDNSTSTTGIAVVGLNTDAIFDNGDINGDGEINSDDVTLLRKYLLGTADAGFNPLFCDVNNDGKTNVSDLLNVKKKKLVLDDAINNASLLPKYYKTQSSNIDQNNVPDWTKDLIIGEANIYTATPQGTFDAAKVKLINHYAEMGVNGIWITPVFERGVSSPNGYINMGIDTIDPSLTGGKTGDAGWAEVKEFVDAAHAKNIRVFFDITFHGVTTDSPLLTSHPTWFNADVNEYGARSFKWTDTSVSGDIKNWFAEQIVAIADKTGCDGFRYDMMPVYAVPTSVDVEATIVNALKAKGHYMFIMSETPSERTGSFAGRYACEQVSLGEMLENYADAPNYFLEKYNLASFIRDGNSALSGAGAYKYYAYAAATHDNKTAVIKGNRLAIGYQTIFSPFIPIIYLGEEWNNPNYAPFADNALYYNTIDWDLRNTGENRAFFEDVKEMIRIRRTYNQLFANFEAAQFKDTNIVNVNYQYNGTYTSAYARYYGNTAIVVCPNNGEVDVTGWIKPDLTAIGLNGYTKFTVTNVETGEVLIDKGSKTDIATISNIPLKAKDQTLIKITAE